MNLGTIRKKVRSEEYDLSEHAHSERQAIEATILKGSIIEMYPNDPRGESCLVGSKSLHIVCGFRQERLLIITNYRPKLPKWISWRKRAKELKSRV